MSKPRGRSHTTLTETATLVIHELTKLPHITMIAPGEIRTAGKRTRGGRFVTIIDTSAGVELLITGQGVQRVAVHTPLTAQDIKAHFISSKTLRAFTFATRVRKPGI